MSDPLRQCQYGTPGHQPCVACSHEVAIRTLASAQKRLRDIGSQWDRLTRILLAAEGDDLCEVVAAIIMERDALRTRLAGCVAIVEAATTYVKFRRDTTWYLKLAESAWEDEHKEIKQRLFDAVDALDAQEGK